MIDIQNVLYSNRDVYFKPRLSTMRVINSITIDMTGWAENENKNAEGIYSYSATFIDDNSCKQTAVCTGMKSGGMQKLLTELRHRFNLVTSDGTDVYVICPKEDIANKALSHGGISHCCVQALRHHGMKALDIWPTSENQSDVRLESVLDEVVYQTQVSAGYVTPRHTNFPKSVYHYDVVERRFREGQLDISEYY